MKQILKGEDHQNRTQLLWQMRASGDVSNLKQLERGEENRVILKGTGAFQKKLLIYENGNHEEHQLYFLDLKNLCCVRGK